MKCLGFEVFIYLISYLLVYLLCNFLILFSALLLSASLGSISSHFLALFQAFMHSLPQLQLLAIIFLSAVLSPQSLFSFSSLVSFAGSGSGFVSSPWHSSWDSLSQSIFLFHSDQFSSLSWTGLLSLAFFQASGHLQQLQVQQT